MVIFNSMEWKPCRDRTMRVISREAWEFEKANTNHINIW